jgi:hypothetical protein
MYSNPPRRRRLKASTPHLPGEDWESFLSRIEVDLAACGVRTGTAIVVESYLTLRRVRNASGFFEKDFIRQCVW